MAAQSSGLLLHRRTGAGLEVLIVHPGGPFWAKKDEGAWSIPKGEHGPDEDPLAAARREFAEELGAPAPAGDAIDLGTVTQKNRKVVHGFALAGDLDVTTVVSNTFTVEWPPRSGRQQAFPEVDRAEWVHPDLARQKLNPAQAALVDRLVEHLEEAAG